VGDKHSEAEGNILFSTVFGVHQREWGWHGILCILFERNPIILRSGMAGAVHGRNAARSTMACKSGARRPSLESWPDPPDTLAQGPTTVQLQEFALQRGAQGRDLHILLALLGRNYLLSLPFPKGAVGFDDFSVVTNR
jgi:hypothetical protein